jgi:hypothetical protein
MWSSTAGLCQPDRYAPERAEVGGHDLARLDRDLDDGSGDHAIAVAQVFAHGGEDELRLGDSFFERWDRR